MRFLPLVPPPSRATAGRHIPLCGGAVSFSAFLTCLSPRNSVRTCALARVEGSVPPTSGFGDRRSPLSYTRILFERVRICTSHGATTIGETALLVSKVAARLSALVALFTVYLFQHRSMVQRPVPLPSI